jgi:hypothetical protein
VSFLKLLLLLLLLLLEDALSDAPAPAPASLATGTGAGGAGAAAAAAAAATAAVGVAVAVAVGVAAAAASTVAAAAASFNSFLICASTCRPSSCSRRLQWAVEAAAPSFSRSSLTPLRSMSWTMEADASMVREEGTGQHHTHPRFLPSI